MRKGTRNITTALGCAVLLVFGSNSSWGQAERQREGTVQRANQAERRAGGQHYGQQGVSDQIVQLLIHMNRGEIKCSKKGQEQAQSEQVKQFAQEMVDAHTQYLQKLQQAAGQSAQPPTTASNQRGQREQQAQPGQQPQRITPQTPSSDVARDQQRDSIQTEVETEAASDGSFLGYVIQLGEQRGKLMEQELQQKQGAEWDKCFMGQQILMHTEALAALQSAQNQVSESLQGVISEGIQTTQAHLEKAKSIAKSLEQQAGNTQSQQRQTDL